MRLVIGMPIVDVVAGECFSPHVVTIVEAMFIVGTGNLTTVTPIGLTPHDYARHVIQEQAREFKCDRLFFMDDDTITPRGGITELMRVMDEDPECVAVSGHYLRRGYPYTCVWSKKVGDTFLQISSDGGIHEIDMTGLGCCLLNFKWLEKNVPQPWFKMKQDDNRTIVSDDITLFEKIRAAGGKVLGNANVRCPHIGKREFVITETADSYRIAAKTLESIMANQMGQKKVPIELEVKGGKQ